MIAFRSLKRSCFVFATALALGFSSLSAWAGSQVPFKATFTTEFESVLAFPFVNIEVAGIGQASHLGKTTAVSDDQVLDLLTGTVTATYHLTGANGDQLVVELLVHATFFPDFSGLTIGGDWQAIGGTGRFDGATGAGTLHGVALFTSDHTGVDHFTMTGTISSPGSLH